METNATLRNRERASAPPEDWRNLIRETTHEDEVVNLVRDHMALWSPEEIVRLPEDCRPGRIRDGDDISQWAFTLASTHCAGAVPRDDEPLLDRMLEFITQAAIRVAELKGAVTADSAQIPS